MWCLITDSSERHAGHFVPAKISDYSLRHSCQDPGTRNSQHRVRNGAYFRHHSVGGGQQTGRPESVRVLKAARHAVFKIFHADHGPVHARDLHLRYLTRWGQSQSRGGYQCNVWEKDRVFITVCEIWPQTEDYESQGREVKHLLIFLKVILFYLLILKSQYQYNKKKIKKSAQSKKK